MPPRCGWPRSIMGRSRPRSASPLSASTNRSESELAHPQPAVEAVGDIEEAVPAQGEPAREIELGLPRRAAVAGVAAFAGAGDRLDAVGLRRGDAADAVVVAVGEVEVSRLVEEQAVGIVEPRLGRR